MGRYSFNEPKKSNETGQIHPIWRAVGFVMVVLIPIMGFAAASLILQENAVRKWFTIPKDLRGPAADPELWVRIIIAVAVIFILYIIYSLITFIITRITSPSRYGPYDVPQPRQKVKRYKR